MTHYSDKSLERDLNRGTGLNDRPAYLGDAPMNQGKSMFPQDRTERCPACEAAGCKECGAGYVTPRDLERMTKGT